MTSHQYIQKFKISCLLYTSLGIYPLYAAVRLFGKPTHATYQAQKLDNSIDLNGDGILSYPNYQVHIKAGKNITSNLPCEIYTTDGTLTLNTIEHVQSATFTDHKGNEEMCIRDSL